MRAARATSGLSDRLPAVVAGVDALEALPPRQLTPTCQSSYLRGARIYQPVETGETDGDLGVTLESDEAGDGVGASVAAPA